MQFSGLFLQVLHLELQEIHFLEFCSSKYPIIQSQSGMISLKRVLSHETQFN
jgi:hypothetical protein